MCVIKRYRRDSVVWTGLADQEEQWNGGVNGAATFARMQAAMYHRLEHNTKVIFKSAESGAHHDWVSATTFNELVTKIDGWRDVVFRWMDDMIRVYTERTKISRAVAGFLVLPAGWESAPSCQTLGDQVTPQQLEDTDPEWRALLQLQATEHMQEADRNLCTAVLDEVDDEPRMRELDAADDGEVELLATMHATHTAELEALFQAANDRCWRRPKPSENSSWKHQSQRTMFMDEIEGEVLTPPSPSSRSSSPCHAFLYAASDNENSVLEGYNVSAWNDQVASESESSQESTPPPSYPGTPESNDQAPSYHVSPSAGHEGATDKGESKGISSRESSNLWHNLPKPTEEEMNIPELGGEPARIAMMRVDGISDEETLSNAPPLQFVFWTPEVAELLAHRPEPSTVMVHPVSPFLMDGCTFSNPISHPSLPLPTHVPISKDTRSSNVEATAAARPQVSDVADELIPAATEEEIHEYKNNSEIYESGSDDEPLDERRVWIHGTHQYRGS
ncbi:hypothetical protein DFH07DRAFT_775583 [Mycena maculata]|uniref:Uncharacterized protein n=1 Tax=Mycena maculata TaxID=230809 RepID=A0AAD7N7D1_9AGAR|nr:hypothetical protein DFH07DRAFT_775583 [Mycena maculata]